MNKLRNYNLEKIKEFMISKARDLERYAFEYCFLDGDKKNYVEALKEFQNEDGGFGNGLEPDFLVPDSSPIATTIGLLHLERMENDSDTEDMIKKAVAYLEKVYDDKDCRWYSVPKNINQYPHAPWWETDDKGKNAIDNSWGNPTAEIIGYLIKHQKYLKRLKIDRIIDNAIEVIKNKSSYASEHEVYCFIRMYNKMDIYRKNEIRKYLLEAVEQLVNNDISEWENYVATPLKFIQWDSEDSFGIENKDIDKNLDYIIQMFHEKEIIEPNWQWGCYQEEWNCQKVKWSGVIMLENLLMLDKFNRIESSGM